MRHQRDHIGHNLTVQPILSTFEAINDEDYAEGFYSYMNRNYDGVFAVTNTAMYSLIPHFEIGGK